jgi:hypothetical protein
MGSAMVIPFEDSFCGSIVLDATEELIQRRIKHNNKEVLLVTFCVVRSGQLALEQTLSFLWIVDVEDTRAPVTFSLSSSSAGKFLGQFNMNTLCRGCSLTIIWACDLGITKKWVFHSVFM